MSAINLSKRDVRAAMTKLDRVFTKADKSKGGIIDRKELKAFDGKGQAALNKLYAYANHFENGVDADKYDTVSTNGAKQAMRKIGNALIKKMDQIGDKDGRLDGSELKHLSDSMAALARFAHAQKS